MSDNFKLLSRFNPDANFKTVRIGSDSPVLEVELNELQDISEHRYKSFINSYIGDGIAFAGDYVFSDNTLNIRNDYAFVKGNVLEITELNLNLYEGESAYLTVWEETVTHLSKIPYKGNVQETRFVENTLLDPRINKETSRRIQVLYDLTKTPQEGKDNLYIGKVENGEFLIECNLKGYQSEVFVQTLTTSSKDTHVITTDKMYKLGVNALMVFVNGILQVCGQDYVEVNSRSIKFKECLNEGLDVIIIGTARPMASASRSHNHEHGEGGSDPLDIIDLSDRENVLNRIIDRLEYREIDCGTFGDLYVSEDDEIYDGGYF